MEWYERRRFGDLADGMAARYPERAALVFQDERYSFAEMAAEIDAAGMRAFGITKETADLLGGWKDQEGRTAGDDYGVHYETFVAELKTAIDKIDYSLLRFN